MVCGWPLLTHSSAIIRLHEPFALPGNEACTSAFAILQSSRAIIDLLHGLSSTSYDVSSLDSYPFVCHVKSHVPRAFIFADFSTDMLVYGRAHFGQIPEGCPRCQSPRPNRPIEDGDFVPSVRLTDCNKTERLTYFTGACCPKPENAYLLPVWHAIYSVLRAFN